MNRFIWHLLPGVRVIIASFPLPKTEKLPKHKIRAFRKDLWNKLLHEENINHSIRFDEYGNPSFSTDRKISTAIWKNKLVLAVSEVWEIGVDLQTPTFGNPLHITVEEKKIPVEEDIYNTLYFIRAAREAVYKAHGISELSFENTIRLQFDDGIPFLADVHGSKPGLYRLYPAQWENLFMVVAIRQEP